MKIHKYTSGFTLIELLVVLTLVGVLTMLVVSKISNSSQYSISAIANQIAQDIQYTQSLAMSRGFPYKIQLNKESYRIGKQGETIRQIKLPGGTRISGGKTIQFNSLGAPSPRFSALSDQYRFTISSGSAKRNIIVSNETGFVEVVR